jgi:hypothetical protein
MNAPTHRTLTARATLNTALVGEKAGTNTVQIVQQPKDGGPMNAESVCPRFNACGDARTVTVRVTSYLDRQRTAMFAHRFPFTPIIRQSITGRWKLADVAQAFCTLAHGRASGFEVAARTTVTLAAARRERFASDPGASS